MQEFAGTVAVVTGGGSGIGRALAVRLAAEGCAVAIADLDQAGMDGTVAAIAETAPGAATSTTVVDVRDPQEVDGFADGVFERFGQADVLCLNAGVFVGGVLWERPAVDLDFVIDINLHGILNGVRSFLPRMVAQDTEGHVVCTASVAGLFGSPFAGPYNISKFAAFAAAETVAHDLIASGSKLRGSVLCPGIIKTPIAHTAQDRNPFPGTETTADQKFVTDLLVDLVDEKGLDPSHAADCVIDAIRRQDFLILTHPHHADLIVERAQALARRELPPVADYT